MRFTNLAKTVRKVSGAVGEAAGGCGVQIRDWIRVGKSGVTFWAGRRKYHVTGVGMGNLDRAMFVFDRSYAILSVKRRP